MVIFNSFLYVYQRVIIQLIEGSKMPCLFRLPPKPAGTTTNSAPHVVNEDCHDQIEDSNCYLAAGGILLWYTSDNLQGGAFAVMFIGV